jgi:hypothetical protein
VYDEQRRKLLQHCSQRTTSLFHSQGKNKIYAYPNAQNDSKFVLEISSTHSGSNLCVTFSPLISSVTPVNPSLNIISSTAPVSVFIGVLLILAKRLPPAIFVAIVFLLSTPPLTQSMQGERDEPITLGQSPLILIPSASKGFAIDLTAPTTACLETAYIGAIGNG